MKNNIFDSSTCLSLAQLDAYVENRLSPQEHHEIEKHLIDCSFCSDALEGLALSPGKQKVEKIVRAINKDIRADLTPRVKRTYAKIYYATAAAALLIFIFLLNFGNNESSSELLYAEFFKPYPNTIPLVRGEDFFDSLKNAMVEYEASNYDEAQKILQTIVAGEPNNMIAFFYFGITNLCLDNPKQAIEVFEEILVANNDFIEEAEWYLALAYLKNKELERAKLIFERIALENGNYKGQSENLLNLLNDGKSQEHK